MSGNSPRGVHEQRAREAQADVPADKGVARRQQPGRQLDRHPAEMGEHGAADQRHQEGAGGNAQQAGDDRPTIASASVSASGTQATGGNQTMAAGPWEALTPNSWATSAATAATPTTLRYCMTATSRMSAP